MKILLTMDGQTILHLHSVGFLYIVNFYPTIDKIPNSSSSNLLDIFIINKLVLENPIFETVKSKVIISLFGTVRLSVSIAPRNLYISLKSIKENIFIKAYSAKILSVQYNWSFCCNTVFGVMIF